MDVQYSADVPAAVEDASPPMPEPRRCACSCGRPLPASGRRYRYATDACALRGAQDVTAARNASHYAANAGYRIWRRTLLRGGLLTPEREAVLDRWRGQGAVDGATARRLLGLPPSLRDPAWGLPAPEREGRMPGSGPCSLALDPSVRVPHDRIAALHGMVTALDGRAHDERAPRWALVPWEAGCGWAVVWVDAEGAEHRGTVGEARLFGVDRGLVVGAAGRIAWPVVAPGRSRVDLSTLTTVSVRRTLRNGGRTVHASPTTEGIVSGLVHLADRLRAELRPEDLRVVVVSAAAESSTVRAGPKMKGRVEGWEGRAVLDVNAPARWLLEIAAAGWGLGGKVAYGFGAVRVRAVLR